MDIIEDQLGQLGFRYIKLQFNIFAIFTFIYKRRQQQHKNIVML